MPFLSPKQQRRSTEQMYCIHWWTTILLQSHQSHTHTYTGSFLTRAGRGVQTQATTRVTCGIFTNQLRKFWASWYPPLIAAVLCLSRGEKYTAYFAHSQTKIPDTPLNIYIHTYTTTSHTRYAMKSLPPIKASATLVAFKCWLQSYLGITLTFLVTGHTHTHTQPFYGPFSRTIWVSWCQKRTSGLYGARED